MKTLITATKILMEAKLAIAQKLSCIFKIFISVSAHHLFFSLTVLPGVDPANDGGRNPVGIRDGEGVGEALRCRGGPHSRRALDGVPVQSLEGGGGGGRRASDHERVQVQAELEKNKYFSCSKVTSFFCVMMQIFVVAAIFAAAAAVLVVVGGGRGEKKIMFPVLVFSEQMYDLSIVNSNTHPFFQKM